MLADYRRYLHGGDAYHEVRHRDLLICRRLLNDIKLALENLHDAGLVFGGVRRTSIMVYKSREKGKEEYGVGCWLTLTGLDLSVNLRCYTII